jgi:hypothetical protein
MTQPELMPVRGATLKANCSVGIARFPEDGNTQDGPFKSADIAHYDAKQNGRNTFCWHRPPDRFIAEVNGGDITASNEPELVP